MHGRGVCPLRRVRQDERWLERCRGSVYPRRNCLACRWLLPLNGRRDKEVAADQPEGYKYDGDKPQTNLSSHQNTLLAPVNDILTGHYR